MDEISDLLKKAVVSQTSKKAIAFAVGRYAFLASPPLSIALGLVVPKIIDYVISKFDVDCAKGISEDSIDALEIELSAHKIKEEKKKVDFHFERMNKRI